MNVPSDKFLLLSFVNTKLRDNFSSLDDFCDNFDCQKQEIIQKLHSIGYIYDEKLNKFI